MEFANTRGTYKALNAEVCDLIHGETLQGLSNVDGLQPQGVQSLRFKNGHFQ